MKISGNILNSGINVIVDDRQVTESLFLMRNVTRIVILEALIEYRPHVAIRTNANVWWR